MLRSASHLRRGALLIRGPCAQWDWVPALRCTVKRRCTASGKRRLLLASDEASYVNGQAIPVDGGLTASVPYAGKPI